MFTWFSKKVEAVKPLPLSQREKSYSAASGIVYQYIFKGMLGRKHVFAVSANRAAHLEVSVELKAAALLPCAERMGSALKWNEEYALTKLSLFRAFDDAVSPESLVRPILPASEELLAHMDSLNMANEDADATL